MDKPTDIILRALKACPVEYVDEWGGKHRLARHGSCWVDHCGHGAGERPVRLTTMDGEGVVEKFWLDALYEKCGEVCVHGFREDSPPWFAKSGVGEHAAPGDTCLEAIAGLVLCVFGEKR